MAPMPLKLTGNGITMANIVATQLLASDLPALNADEVGQLIDQIVYEFAEDVPDFAYVYRYGHVRDMDEYEAVYHRVIAEIEDTRGQ